MIALRDMEEVSLFKALSQGMIEKLASIADTLEVRAGEYLFHDGNIADYFYVLKKGKVVLEFKNPDGSGHTETVGPGMGVGCSALAGLKEYSAGARCDEPSRLLRWEQSRLRHLFNEDSRLGYLMIKASAKMLNKRVAGKLER